MRSGLGRGGREDWEGRKGREGKRREYWEGRKGGEGERKGGRWEIDLKRIVFEYWKDESGI